VQLINILQRLDLKEVDIKSKLAEIPELFKQSKNLIRGFPVGNFAGVLLPMQNQIQAFPAPLFGQFTPKQIGDFPPQHFQCVSVAQRSQMNKAKMEKVTRALLAAIDNKIGAIKPEVFGTILAKRTTAAHETANLATVGDLAYGQFISLGYAHFKKL